MTQKAGDFFDGLAEEYFEDPMGHENAPFHLKIAQRIQENVRGSILCIGGVWDLADLSELEGRITTVDVSRGMMAQRAEGPVRRVVNDGRTLAFGDASFDHAVLSLVLHHITGESATDARSNVRRVLSEVHRVLKPGGRVWVSELCPPAPVYGVELAAVPVTKRVLALADVPLVVMHAKGFYRKVLEDLGYHEVDVYRPRSPDAGPFDTVEPVLGMPWLKVPRFMFPVKAFLISGQR